MATTKKATKQKQQRPEPKLPGDFSPPYLRGMRDVLKACRRKLTYDTCIQYDQMRTLADTLGVPFLWLLIALEGKDGAVVDLDDVDILNAWLSDNELSREQALGEEV